MRVGAYRVLGPLAGGSSNDVLLAQSTDASGCERLVVLKRVPPKARQDEAFERAFAREAAAYAHLTHPAIASLRDLFTDSGGLVMAFEHVDGPSLGELGSVLQLGNGTLDDGAAIFVMWRVLGALAAAHAAKDPATGEASPVVHRNLNPSNVIVPWDGDIKLADFEIAKLSFGAARPAAPPRHTYGYLAPEQVRGQAATVRSDVYSACLILWELLASRRAIQRGGASDWQLLRNMAEPSFPPLSSLRGDLPTALLNAVAAGLEPNADQRTIDAASLCDALRVAADLDRGRRELVRVVATLQSEGVIRAPLKPQLAAGANTSTANRIRDWAISFAGLVALGGGVGLAFAISGAGRSASAIPGPAFIGAAPTLAVGGALETVALPDTAPAETVPPLETSPIPDPARPLLRAPSSSAGTVSVSAGQAGHRVWIDGRLVGEAPGRFFVACGEHSVRVGSQGTERTVFVRCGHDIDFH